MTRSGIDVVAVDVCQKIELASEEYGIPFMDIMNRVMQIHVGRLRK